MERHLKSKLPNGCFASVSPQRSRIMSSIRGKSNRSTEQVFRMALVRAGVKGWVLHPKQLPGKPDFYFPAKNVAVFIDGCFWHHCQKCGHIPKSNSEFWKAKMKRNRARDKMNCRLLVNSGIRVYRLWEHELKEQSLDALVARVISPAGEKGRSRTQAPYGLG